jgi:hypothetical protein
MSEQIATVQPRRIYTQLDQRWTADEIQTLRIAWRDPNVPTEAIPGMLRDRSIKAARHMANILGLGARPKIPKPDVVIPDPWTAEEDNRLRALWHEMSRQDVAERLKRSPNAVSNRAIRLQLGKSRFARAQVAARAAAAVAEARVKKLAMVNWTDAEVAVLVEDWPNIERIHKRTGRSRSGIERQAHKRGLPPKTGFPKEMRRNPRPVKVEERLSLRPERQPGIARKCLCCGDAFEAPTRFIRMCDRCKGQRA